MIKSRRSLILKFQRRLNVILMIGIVKVLTLHTSTYSCLNRLKNISREIEVSLLKK